MKSDYPATLVSLCRMELFPNVFEIQEEHPHSKKKTLCQRLCMRPGLKPPLAKIYREKSFTFPWILSRVLPGQESKWLSATRRPSKTCHIYFFAQNKIVSVKVKKKIECSLVATGERNRKRREKVFVLARTQNPVNIDDVPGRCLVP